MKCPICNEQMTEYAPEQIHPIGRNSSIYSGRYVCAQHGSLRVSGKIQPNGIRTVTDFKPPCPMHGLVPIVSEPDNTWRCVECGRRLGLVAGRIIQTWPRNGWAPADGAVTGMNTIG